MKKCPLKNFEECNPDCAWYFKSLKRKGCSIHNIAHNDSLIELLAIQRNLDSIDSTLSQKLKN